MFYVGIDWADQKYDLFILNDQGEPVGQPLVIKKSAADFQALLLRLRKLSPNPTDLKIGIETPHNVLIDFLLAAGYPIFVMHPAAMKSFRKRYRTTNARDDCYDSYVLADVLRTDVACWHKIDRDSELTEEIRMLAVDHHHLIQEQTELHNVFRETLKAYYPEYVHFFKDLSCSTSLAFCQTYSHFAAAAKLTQEQLQAFFKEHHLWNWKRIQRIYQTLQQKPMVDAESTIHIKSTKALTYAALLVEANKSCQVYEQKIKDRLQQHPDYELFDSFPGVGDVTAARLIALFGDHRERYENVSAIQSIAGTCPVTESTGYDQKSKKGYRVVYFRQGCNKVYRSFIYTMAFASLTKASWAKAYYDQHRAKGHTHPHALRCLANLELKILFSMWKNRTPYDENIFLAQKTRHELKSKNK